MKVRFLVFIVAFIGLASCEGDVFIPKPVGYARIDFPDHAYRKLNTDLCPYSFEYGKIANLVPVRPGDGNRCWFNLEYPNQKAKVHFTYYDIEATDVEILIEDTRILAMKHLVKADDFEESVVMDTSANVYGIIYDFQGSTASNMQFYLTDSVSHFIRGALYFEVVPQADSLAPSEKYLEEEVMHLIQTFTWK